MSRSDDGDNVIQLPPHGALPAVIGGRLPCLWCNAPTAGTTLAAYGARCLRCYEAYCREQQPSPPFAADKRKDGNKAWAHALRAREKSGERLSFAQREMWRAAARNQLSGGEES